MLANRLRALIAQPSRLFATAISQEQYQPLEEPTIQLQEQQITSDNILFQIVHKSNSLLELVKFYNRESGKMSLVHHSIFLNKCATLIKRQEHDKDDLEEAEKFMRKSAAKLFENQ